MRDFTLDGYPKVTLMVEENIIFEVNFEIIFLKEPACNSVAWNADHENLLCYSGGGALSIKAHNFPAYQQRMQVHRIISNIIDGSFLIEQCDFVFFAVLML